MADPYAGLGTVVQGGQADPYAGVGKVVSGGRPAAKAPTKGRGSEADPYRVGTRYKVGSPEYQREVTKVPLGAYFEDPQGNLRQRMNPGAGQPIRKRQVERVGRAEREATGAAANLNRGLLIGDEGSALMGTVGNVLLGKVGPTTDNPLSIINGLGNSFNNELAKQRAYEDDFDQRRPWAGAAAQTTGMVPTLFVPGGAPAQAATRTEAVVGAAGNAALYAGTAGLADRGTWEERNKQGAVNALVAAPLGAGLTALATRQPRAAPPAASKRTPQEVVSRLGADKTAAYKAAESVGTRYSPEGVKALATEMRSTAQASAFDPQLNPKVARVLDIVEERANNGWSPTLSELDNLRKIISQNVAGSTDKTDRYFGRQLLSVFDDWTANAAGADVIEGSGEEAARLIQAARAANTRYAKADNVARAVQSAESRAASSGSGGNADNAIRQNMRRVMEKGRNWTPEEQNALGRVVYGTPGQNFLRQVGKLSPQGNGLMAMMNLGSAGMGGVTGGAPGAILGAAPGAAGLVSKWFADRATQQNVTRLLEVIARGGPEAQRASQQITALPNGSQFLQELNLLSRGTGAAVNAANQNRPATVATATQ